MSSTIISLIVPNLAINTIDTIAKRFHTKRSLRVTIQDLPDEILDIIFKVVFPLHKNPFLLLRVSTRWRRLVLANPNLWTWIWLDEAGYLSSLYSQLPTSGAIFGPPDGIRFKEPGVHQILKGRYHICGGNKQLLDSLRRAGSLPIQISYSVIPSSTHDSCLDRILTGPISHRVEALSIQCWMVSLGGHPDQMSFPSLRRLDLLSGNGNWNWQLNFLRCLDREAPLLTHLNLQTMLDNSVINLRIWSNLQSLEVVVWPGDIRNNISILHEIIQHCTKLIEFRSSEGLWPLWLPMPNPDILVKVPELRSACSSFVLCHLNLKNLQTLHYVLPEFYPSHGEEISLPQLTTLTLVTRRSFKGIMWLKMPRILSISIIHKSQEPSRDGLMSTTLPTVTDIYMETEENDATLLPVFQFVPNVHRLSFTRRDRSPRRRVVSNFFYEAIQLREARVCPELQTLTLGDSENAIRAPGLTRTPIPKMVEKILKGRRKKGMSMIDFYIYWDKSGRGLTELGRYPS